ncbi:E3 ubiquitin-protein ligase TRIM39-like [Aplochiton taeniatus]
MASLLSEEQFMCCICLDIFNNPVSIPCGHNFCLECIKGFWDTRDRPECPLCKESFLRRPELRINHGFADIAEHFKRSLRVKASAARPSPGAPAPAQRRSLRATPDPEDVSCHVCAGSPRGRAVKSCLVCQASYCTAHLSPHLREPALQKHSLTDPATFPARGLCRRHQWPLELYCKDDQTPACVRCAESDHRSHNTVPMERESKKTRTEMKRTETELQQMVQARLRKVAEIKLAVTHSKRSAETEVEDSVQLYSELVQSIQRSHAELLKEIEGKQEAAESRAEGLIRDLEQEIGELQRRSAELEQLSRTEDHLHLLQSFSSLSSPPPTKNWSEISVHSELCVGTVRKAVSKLVDTINDLEKKLSEAELKRTQQYALEVTLDPVTAASWLVLSADGKQVSLGYQQNRGPVLDDPRRFDSCVCVLGKQGITSGRRYWVVQVGDKTDWDVGVARQSINRKGTVTVRPDHGFWAVCRRKGGDLQACAGPSVALGLRRGPRKIAVFVDYEDGAVTFFDADAGAHLYTFAGIAFAETLYPYFNPCLHDEGRNTAPLVICAAEAGAEFATDAPSPVSPTLPAPPPVPPRHRPSSVRSVSRQTTF